MHNRFKIIYYYNETEDIIHIVDIWDTRIEVNPESWTQLKGSNEKGI